MLLLAENFTLKVLTRLGPQSTWHIAYKREKYYGRYLVLIQIATREHTAT